MLRMLLGHMLPVVAIGGVAQPTVQTARDISRLFRMPLGNVLM